MPFRKRSAAKPSFDPIAAKAELDRATDAVRFWKQQQTDAIEEIAGLEGMGGWIASLTGKKQAYLDDAHARLKHAKQGFQKERAALLAAQQQMGRHQHKQQRKAQADDEHALDLEQVANKIRGTEHPLSAPLATLEDQLDQIAKELMAYQEAIAAAGALNANIGGLKRVAVEAQSRMTGLLGAIPAAAAATRDLPKNVERFNQACLDAGVEPLNITVQGLAGEILTNDHLLNSNVRADLSKLQMKVYDERSMITQIQIQVAALRIKSLEHQTAVHAERRTLLEQAG